MSEVKKISCEEALKQLFEFLDKELDTHKHDEMENHLSICKSCFSRMEFEKRLHKHLKNATQERASDELKSRVKNLINKI